MICFDLDNLKQTHVDPTEKKKHWLFSGFWRFKHTPHASESLTNRHLFILLKKSNGAALILWPFYHLHGWPWTQVSNNSQINKQNTHKKTAQMNSIAWFLSISLYPIYRLNRFFVNSIVNRFWLYVLDWKRNEKKIPKNNKKTLSIQNIFFCILPSQNNRVSFEDKPIF